MGAIKFPHASGNSMSIASPATNPASDLEIKLPATIGTANQYLKNSSTAGTLEFATLSAGKLLQVVQGTTATEVSSTTTSMADTGLTASITPATNSKVLVLVNQSFTVTRVRNSTNNNGMGADILRGSTIIFNSKKNDSNYPYGFYHKGGDTNFNTFRWTINWLDASPGGDGSTSITYKTQFAISTAEDSGQGWAQNDTEGQNNAPTSTMILLEIGA